MVRLVFPLPGLWMALHARRGEAYAEVTEVSDHGAARGSHSESTLPKTYGRDPRGGTRRPRRFIAGMPADEVEIDAVAEEAAAAPLPAVDAVYAEYQRFIAEIAVLPPIPPRTTIWLNDTLQVPLEGTSIGHDDVEVSAPPEPSRPRRVLSPEVERRLAMYGPRSPFSVLDVEREILLERYEAELGAGVVDDEESPL